MVPPQRLFISTPNTIPVSSFARLSQASNLLGLVLRHCEDQTDNVAFIVNDMTLLHQTISSLFGLVGPEAPAPCYTAAALCLR